MTSTNVHPAKTGPTTLASRHPTPSLLARFLSRMWTVLLAGMYTLAGEACGVVTTAAWAAYHFREVWGPAVHAL